MKIIRTNTKYLETKDFMASQEVFSLFWNEEKDILVTHPQPKDLERYYQSEDYMSHSNLQKTWFQNAYAWIRAYNTRCKLSWIKKHLPKTNLRLLDIGSGMGYFVSIAQRKGWCAEGFEPNPNARKTAKTPLQAVLDYTKTYDVITLWHVLEHLPDVDENIAQYKKMLAPEGIMVIAIPNYRAYDAKNYKTFWAGYDVPRHLWHFSKEGLKRILKHHGMTVCATKPMFWDAFYVSILSERYKNKKKGCRGLVRALVIGFLSNIAAIFTGEASSNMFLVKIDR